MQFHFSHLTYTVALLLLLGGAPNAFAQPDFTDSAIISEDDGFPGVCTQPCYEVEKVFEFYNAGNPSAPAVCGVGENTFVYRLTNLTNPPSAATIPSPGIPITEFEIAVDISLVASAGFTAGVGTIAPTSTVVSALNVVTWAFPLSTACPNCMIQGNTSEDLFICSTAGRGLGADNVSTTAIVLDAPGSCWVPTQQEACDIKVEKFCEVLETPGDPHDKDKDKDLDGIPDDPAELCDGKVTSMVIEYTGLGCAATNNTQDGRVVCNGGPGDPIGAAGEQPVDILVTNGRGNITYANVAGVNIGDAFTIEPPGNRRKLNGTTKVRIFEAGTTNLIERVRFKSQCDEGLLPGDEFGSNLITELTTTKGGVITIEDVTPPIPEPVNLCNVPLPRQSGGIHDQDKDKDKDMDGPNPGADVKYTYRIMNIGTVNATNITVNDDVLGTIAGSPIASLAPGETVTLMQTQFIMDDTTNTVTVDGDPGVCQATAEATVTVEQPEDVPDKDTDKDKDKDKDHH